MSGDYLKIGPNCLFTSRSKLAINNVITLPFGVITYAVCKLALLTLLHETHGSELAAEQDEVSQPECLDGGGNYCLRLEFGGVSKRPQIL
jgi:hypothetical protein